MAFKFNAFLNFRSAGAVASMNKAKASFNSLKNSASSLGASLSMVGQGIRSAGLATAPFAAATGFAIKEAADFESQMSKVQSILLINKKEMAPLIGLTKELGATTVFTAKEAADGAEFLARAGFTMQETLAALPGVLDAAAASGVSLGEAALVTANQIGAFDLKASDATKVADVLALTAARTNTSFTELSEALKFGGPFAKQAGISFAETASTFGVFANAGIKASLAGTALKNALLRLSRPTEKALELFGGERSLKEAVLETVDGVTKLRPMEVIMANIATKVAGAKDKLEATKIAAELFGLRGTTAFSSFEAQMLKTLTLLDLPDDRIKRIQEGMIQTFGKDEAMKKWGEFEVAGVIPKLVALRFEIKNATGSASEMAKIRLDNLTGQFILFKSAVSAMLIETGSLLTGPLREGLRVVTDAIQILALGFQAASGPEGVEGVTVALAKSDNQFKHMIGTATEFAEGFRDGFGEIKDFVVNVIEGIKEQWGDSFGDMGLTAKDFGKATVKLLAILTVLSPVLLGISAAAFILTPIFMGIASIFGVITSVAGVVASGFGLVGNALLWVANFFGVAVTKAAIFKAAFLALTSPFLIVGSAIGAIVAGIIGGIVNVIENWEMVKAAFADRGFLGAAEHVMNLFLDGIGLMFEHMWDNVKIGFSKVIDWIKDKIKDLTGTTLFKMVSGLVDLFGDDEKPEFKVITGGGPIRVPEVSYAEQQKQFGMTGTSPIAEYATDIGEQATRGRTSPKIRSDVGTGATTEVGPLRSVQPQMNFGPLILQGSLETKIKGKDVLISMTRAKIQQSELNGVNVDGFAKRRARQNGEMFTA